MKIGIIIYSNDPETVWNAFRYGNFAITAGEDVKMFLTGRGCESACNNDPLKGKIGVQN